MSLNGILVDPTARPLGRPGWIAALPRSNRFCLPPGVAHCLAEETGAQPNGVRWSAKRVVALAVGPLRNEDRAPVGWKCLHELVTTGDAELREHLAQVVVHRVRADEQAGTDLGVRQAVAGHRGDLGFLRRQITMGLDAAPAGRLAGSP